MDTYKNIAQDLEGMYKNITQDSEKKNNLRSAVNMLNQRQQQNAPQPLLGSLEHSNLFRRRSSRLAARG